MIVRERPGRRASAEGALVLFHGRGADENDLFPLLDVLDPERAPPRLHARAGRCRCRPAARTGTSSRASAIPDPETFAASYREAAEWLDSLPYERIVLGGFSQGCVMALALGLGGGRPRPAAIAGFSGFIPQVEGWELDTERAASRRSRSATARSTR